MIAVDSVGSFLTRSPAVSKVCKTPFISESYTKAEGFTSAEKDRTTTIDTFSSGWLNKLSDLYFD